LAQREIVQRCSHSPEAKLFFCLLHQPACRLMPPLFGPVSIHPILFPFTFIPLSGTSSVSFLNPFYLSKTAIQVKPAPYRAAHLRTPRIRERRKRPGRREAPAVRLAAAINGVDTDSRHTSRCGRRRRFGGDSRRYCVEGTRRGGKGWNGVGGGEAAAVGLAALVDVVHTYRWRGCACRGGLGDGC